jgi:hypothetical protein
MVRPGAVSPSTPGSPDEPIAALVRDFQQRPLECLHEPELHAKFYLTCRSQFPNCSTQDQQVVAAFRYQYETIWRYRQGDRFSQRYRNVGTTAIFDFVVLRGSHVHQFPFLTVVNKIEKERNKLRGPPGLESRYTSGIIQCVIELKMVNVQDALETTEADANRLEDRMLASCCKLGQERPKRAYVVGLSRGPLPDLSRARSMVANCLQLYKSRYPGGSLCVLVATPEQTILGGDWPQELEFPNVAVLDDLPVSNEDTS